MTYTNKTVETMSKFIHPTSFHYCNRTLKSLESHCPTFIYQQDEYIKTIPRVEERLWKSKEDINSLTFKEENIDIIYTCFNKIYNISRMGAKTENEIAFSITKNDKDKLYIFMQHHGILENAKVKHGRMFIVKDRDLFFHLLGLYFYIIEDEFLKNVMQKNIKQQYYNFKGKEFHINIIWCFFIILFLRATYNQNIDIFKQWIVINDYQSFYKIFASIGFYNKGDVDEILEYAIKEPKFQNRLRDLKHEQWEGNFRSLNHNLFIFSDGYDMMNNYRYMYDGYDMMNIFYEFLLFLE